jgi:hypothetical protein
MSNIKILKEITHSQLNEIFYFIGDSLCQFDKLNLRKEDLRILMPNSTKCAFNYYRRQIMFQTQEEKFHAENFFDVQVYPHYKSEIVVYCTKFDLYKECDQPKIFEL